MADTRDTAAGRVQAYLNAFDDPEHPQGAISTLRSEGLRLTVADLRAVLAEHRQMREQLAAHDERESADAAAGSYALRAEQAEADRDRHASRAQMFQNQHGGALSTIRVHADQLRRLANLNLLANPDHDGWNLVATYAQSLLRYAGPSLDLRAVLADGTGGRLFSERNRALAELDEVRARVAELEAELAPQEPVTDTVQLVIPRGPMLDGMQRALRAMGCTMAGPLPLERDPIPTYVIQPLDSEEPKP